MESFIKKGFYTIGALRTNRILYPKGIRSKASEIAQTLKPSDTSLVTVGGREFYIWRYEGKLNGITNAVVLLSYSKNAFGQKQALRMFISTNVDLSTQDILEIYVSRWPIEVFFRSSKSKLGLDTYQVRSQKGIDRYWLIMSLTHYLCCIWGRDTSFLEAFSQATLGCLCIFQNLLIYSYKYITRKEELIVNLKWLSVQCMDVVAKNYLRQSWCIKVLLNTNQCGRTIFILQFTYISEV